MFLLVFVIPLKITFKIWTKIVQHFTIFQFPPLLMNKTKKGSGFLEYSIYSYMLIYLNSFLKAAVKTTKEFAKYTVLTSKWKMADSVCLNSYHLA